MFKSIAFVLSLFVSTNCLADSFHNNSPDVTELLISRNVSELLLKLQTEDHYHLTSVDETSVIIDDGTRGYIFSMTPTLDGYLACKVEFWVSPYSVDGLDRVYVSSSDCPKKVN